MIYPTCNISFSSILLNNNITISAETYVITTGSLLQLINIHWCRKISNIICQQIVILRVFQLIFTNEKYWQHLFYQMSYMSPVN